MKQDLLLHVLHDLYSNSKL